MKLMARDNIGGNLLVLLMILLVAVVAAELFYWDFGDLSADDGKRGTMRIESLQEAFALPPMSTTYTEMVKRPLFVPNRRPPAQVSITQSNQATPMAAGELSRIYGLEGIILSAGNNMVLLKEKATGKYFHLGEGENINGLEMQALERDRVTLKKGSHTEIMELKMQLRAGSQSMMLPTGPPPTPATTNSANSKTEEGKPLSLYERRKALRARQAREREARKNSTQ